MSELSRPRSAPLGLRVNAHSDVIHKDDCHHVSKHSAQVVGIFKSDRACSHCLPDLPR